jgi:hypothetical protein
MPRSLGKRDRDWLLSSPKKGQKKKVAPPATNFEAVTRQNLIKKPINFSLENPDSFLGTACLERHLEMMGFSIRP